MITYVVRTVAGYYKIQCDIRDFEQALAIVRKRQDATTKEKKNPLVWTAGEYKGSITIQKEKEK